MSKFTIVLVLTAGFIVGGLAILQGAQRPAHMQADTPPSIREIKHLDDTTLPFCDNPHVYVDQHNTSGCAADTNTCKEATCEKGIGHGPCKTLTEINQRCPSWYERGIEVTLIGVSEDSVTYEPIDKGTWL